ncbi:hypothetical protein LY76DRAFT_347976 [Colletotrichum caudatum]|nr:hypothetical protein LY76DRAFT_347976 [Colletotrichum caudatum]
MVGWGGGWDGWVGWTRLELILTGWGMGGITDRSKTTMLVAHGVWWIRRAERDTSLGSVECGSGGACRWTIRFERATDDGPLMGVDRGWDAISSSSSSTASVFLSSVEWKTPELIRAVPVRSRVETSTRAAGDPRRGVRWKPRRGPRGVWPEIWVIMAGTSGSRLGGRRGPSGFLLETRVGLGIAAAAAAAAAAVVVSSSHTRDHAP